MKLPVNWHRRLRFFALEQIALPAGILPLRMLVRTWRVQGSDQPSFLDAMAAPRALVATFHGMFLHLLAYSHIPPQYGRRLVVLVSPSLDGRLLAATLSHFGIDHVFGTTSARGVGGAREFISRIAAGEIGIIAADGPNGPCCAAKPGLLEIAAIADARIFLATTSATPGLTLPSWDRTHLPAPFATVKLKGNPFTPEAAAAPGDQLAAMQSELIDLARSIASPVLPVSRRD